MLVAEEPDDSVQERRCARRGAGRRNTVARAIGVVCCDGGVVTSFCWNLDLGYLCWIFNALEMCVVLRWRSDADIWCKLFATSLL